MITPGYTQMMARYNAWQNQSIYAAAATLTNEARRRNRGAFFGSIHATLNHLLWGDQAWMHRFANTPAPLPKGIAASVRYFEDFDELRRERTASDAAIIDWAERVPAEWFAGDLTWFSGSAQRDMTKPRWLLVTHMFNHQTHHRGQIHAMLTAAGAKPDDTDIPFMPDTLQTPGQTPGKSAEA